MRGKAAADTVSARRFQKNKKIFRWPVTAVTAIPWIACDRHEAIKKQP
jgi:hypothetical protein